MITMPTVNQHAAWIGLKSKSQSSLVSLSVKTKMEDIEKALTGKDQQNIKYSSTDLNRVDNRVTA
jgi:hypothetical protein